MFEEIRDIPRAYTVTSPHEPATSAAVMRWALEQRRLLGAGILLYGPGRRNLDEMDASLVKLAQQPYVQSETWKTIHNAGWQGGIVVALWPNQEHLLRMDENPSTAALVVLTWNEHEVEPSARSRGAQALGEGPITATLPALDPVVLAAMDSMAVGINQSNGLRRDDRARVAKFLLVLKQAGFGLEPAAIFEEALRRGWRGDNAEELRTLVEAVNAGRTVVGARTAPVRADVLAYWRERAAEQSSGSG